jgi:hypothetical protein
VFLLLRSLQVGNWVENLGTWKWKTEKLVNVYLGLQDFVGATVPQASRSSFLVRPAFLSEKLRSRTPLHWVGVGARAVEHFLHRLLLPLPLFRACQFDGCCYLTEYVCDAGRSIALSIDHI